ncbi:MAG: hypothetical protein K0V04_41480 [Deltaproteobacteria bacterium]|nr:hypothetical protein [Deltaproteobacteria bacterium]
MIIAAGLAAMTMYVMQYDEADAAFFAAAGGIALTCAARGVIGLIRRDFPWWGYATAPVLGGALAFVVLHFGEPVAARHAADRTWATLLAEEQAQDFDPERWVQQYELAVAPQHRRPQWRVHYFDAVTNRASRNGRARTLRELLSRLDRAEVAYPDLELSASRSRAEAALDAQYDAAIRVFESHAPPDSTRVDPELRSTAARLLRECRRTRCPAIELRISSQARMQAPEGFAMPRGVELIPPGDVFEERWQQHRDSVLEGIVCGALRPLAPSELIEISSAPPPSPAPTIELHLEIERTRSVYRYSTLHILDLEGARKGVFGIRVSWRVRLLSADGTMLYDWTSSNTPAEEIEFESEYFGDEVPYRALIRSAYAKFAEELLARAGLPGPTHDELMARFRD